MKIKTQTDNIIAPISASVGGSVAMLRISGNHAISISNQIFKGKNLEKENGNKFFHGPLINKGSEIVDDVVLLLYRNPNSYTGEDVVEICCHSNPFIIEEIVQLYLSFGCRVAEPGEFSKRAFLNGKMDLIQAEAVADLIAAKSTAVAKNSLGKIEGKLSELVKRIKAELIDTASLLELDLDFNEEDLEIIQTSQVVEAVNKAIMSINELLKTFEYGKILSKGVEVLITGKPNVGKSSLMNALLDHDRVIVSSIPGTTRDIIHEDIVINNVMIRFIDTAGIHLAEDQIEAEGVDRAIGLFDRADIILLVIDASQMLTQEDNNLIKTASYIYKNKLIVLANKTDLKVNPICESFLVASDLTFKKISAKTGLNIQHLKNEIINKIYKIDRDISEDIFISNQRQNDILIKTRESLIKVDEALQQNLSYEYAAVDMRDAINSLSEITGEISTNEVLNNIFSNFCIGK